MINRKAIFLGALVAGVLIFIGSFAIRWFADYRATQLEGRANSELSISISERYLLETCGEKKSVELVLCSVNAINEDRENTRNELDLRAQQDMASWAVILLLFSLLSFIVSSLGLAALVWTFIETRKMTQNQARAYIEVAGGGFYHHPTFGTVVNLALHNWGQTPATSLKIKGSFSYRPAEAEGKLEGVPLNVDITGTLELLNPRTTDVCVLKCFADFPYNEMIKRSKERFDRRFDAVGTAECSPERIILEAVAEFSDVFGRSHFFHVSVSTDSLRESGENTLTGGGRHYKAREYERKYFRTDLPKDSPFG